MTVRDRLRRDLAQPPGLIILHRLKISSCVFMTNGP